MRKIIKCRRCGQILARQEEATASYSDIVVYTFRIRIFNNSPMIVCDCGEVVCISEDNLVEAKKLAHSLS